MRRKLCCFSAEYTNFAECYDIALTGLNVEKLSKLKIVCIERKLVENFVWPMPVKLLHWQVGYSVRVKWAV